MQRTCFLGAGEGNPGLRQKDQMGDPGPFCGGPPRLLQPVTCPQGCVSVPVSLGDTERGCPQSQKGSLKVGLCPTSTPCPAPTRGAHGADPSNRAGLGCQVLPGTGPTDAPVPPIGRVAQCSAEDSCEAAAPRVWGKGSLDHLVLATVRGTGYCHVSAVRLFFHRREAVGTDALSGWWRAWDWGPWSPAQSPCSFATLADGGRKTTKTSGSFLSPSHAAAALRAEPSRGTVPANTTPTSCKTRRRVPSWGVGRGDSTAGGRG